MKTLKPWILVIRPGKEDEKILSEHDCWREAHNAWFATKRQQKNKGEEFFVMRRLPDGSLTEEWGNEDHPAATALYRGNRMERRTRRL
jgi:hypothetical protein